MDIALKLKRVVATAAAGAIFASSAGMAMAQTFSDVSTDAWYFDYVEQLVDDGVVDASDNYRPADALNRAEIVKMAVTAIDGLAGYEAPATPTFDDVAADAWFFDYVEAAVQLGVVNGYTDASGNLTGFFGPGDTVNRAGATKILVNAFSVPTDLSPASGFPDVVEADWFHDYVVTAYNQSILDGYDNGYFGPADAVTRAQVAKLVVNSQNPVERATDPTDPVDPVDPTDPVDSDGDLEVSLNDDAAASSTLPISANGVELASYDFTADSDDVMLTNLVVTRGGVGQAGDWSDLYIYDGAQRLTTGRTINNDSNTATFPLDVLVEAGTTTTLTLVGDVDASTDASSQHYFYIASAADVTTNAQSTAGDFPVAGNTFTMGGSGTVVNDVTVEPGTAPSKVTLGEQDVEIASIRIEAGSENDVALHQLALTNGGSLDSSKLENLRLLRGSDEVATASGFVGDIVTFVLDTPYVIDEGQTKTFYVNADLIGGRTTDDITLYLDEDTDLVAIDQQYGFGANVVNTFTQGLANTVTLEGGDVTVTDNGPASTQLATESNNNELLNFSVTTARDLTVRDTQVLITIQDPSGANPSFTVNNTTTAAAITLGTGGCAASEYEIDLTTTTGYGIGDMFQMGSLYARVASLVGTDICAASASDLTAVASGTAVVEVNPYLYVEDVKIVDLDSGSTLVGPLTQSEDGSLCTSAGVPLAICGAATDTYAEDFSEDYELTGGETRHLSVQVDIEQELVTGYQVRAAVQWPSTGSGESAIKDLDANEFVETSEIIGAGSAALAGNFMFIEENSLSLALASTPTSQEYVQGATAIPALGISMNAGDAGDITVKRLDVRVYADANANFGDNAGVGAIAATDTSAVVGDLLVTADAAGTAANGTTLTIVGGGADTTGVVVSAETATTITLTVETDGGGAADPLWSAVVTAANLAGTFGATVSSPANGADTVLVGDAQVLTLAGGIDGVALANNYGDLAADTLVSSVTLYDGNDIVAGPEGIDLVDGGLAGFTAGTDYYVAQFDDLDLVIPAGGTDTLTAKFTLLNTATGTNYLAADVVAVDITAEDDDADTVVASGGSLNATATKDPQLTVLEAGTLTANSESNPNAEILVAGAQEVLVAKYVFNAEDEDFEINELTILNDLTTDFNAAVSTSSVSDVTIKYPDVNGVEQTSTLALTGGSANFSSLDFYAPAGEDATLEVYAHVSSVAMAGEEISGKTFRLGLQNTGNTNSTFEAVGQSSSSALYFDGGTEVTDGDKPEEFVVRTSRPIFSQVEVSDDLGNGNTPLFSFDVTTDSSGGSVSMARFVFDIGHDVTDLSAFSFSIGGDELDSVGANQEVSIKDQAGDDLGAAGTYLPGDTQVVVALLEDHAFSGTKRFLLEATVSGATTAGDSVSTSLNDGDEIVAVAGLIEHENANTGYLVDPVASQGLFDSAALYTDSVTGGTDPVNLELNVVWSDRSATTGSLNEGDAASSIDWTNGYLLGINELTSSVVTK